MAVYNVDFSGGNAGAVSSIESILAAAGVITQVSYRVSPFLIFTTPRSNKVIKIDVTNGVYFGDAYSSGSTITNQKNVIAPGAITIVSMTIIVTADYLIFTFRSSGGNNYNAIFAITDPGGTFITYGAASTTSGIAGFQAYTTTPAVPTELVPAYTVLTPVLAPDYFWYQSDMYFKDPSTNVLSPNPLKSLKMLSKSRDISSNIMVFGNDIVINLGYTRTTANFSDCCMLLVGGNV